MENKFETSIGTYKTYLAQIIAANTTRDGTGSNIVEVIPGGLMGSRLTFLKGVAITAIANGVLRFFVGPTGSKRLEKEVVTAANALSAATDLCTVVTWTPDGGYLDIQSGTSLWAACHNGSEIWNILARGGDF